MSKLMDYPRLVFLLSFAVMWISAEVGNLLCRRLRPLREDELKEFEVIQTAILTLLGLLIGFSFSMAVSRYDQRKNYEEAEANAIGTEYVRADLFPASDAAKIKELLKNYLDQRILFYTVRQGAELDRINDDTAQLQVQMWSATQVPALANPTPVAAVVVSGMNDVLNSQGYTQFAWWNRIPTAAWGLTGTIAIFCNLMLGYGARRNVYGLFLVLPLAVSISFFLISDIDSPRIGLIRVNPQNLISLAQSLQAH
jgi:hypothetical protein